LAVRIRLSRVGATKRPSYRVVVIDSRRPRDGRALEILGYYDPLTEPATVKIDAERLAAWVGKGALPSDTVAKLIKLNGSAPSPAGTPAADSPAPKPKRSRKKAAAAAKAEAAPPAEEAPAAEATPVEEAPATEEAPAAEEPAATTGDADPAPEAEAPVETDPTAEAEAPVETDPTAEAAPAEEASK
jgi:small subunit ribosomal protein S16